MPIENKPKKIRIYAAILLILSRGLGYLYASADVPAIEVTIVTQLITVYDRPQFSNKEEDWTSEDDAVWNATHPILCAFDDGESPSNGTLTTLSGNLAAVL